MESRKNGTYESTFRASIRDTDIENRPVYIAVMVGRGWGKLRDYN